MYHQPQNILMPEPKLDWFDVLDQENRPVLTEREILRNLQAIVTDADKLPVHEVRPSYIFYRFVSESNAEGCTQFHWSIID